MVQERMDKSRSVVSKFAESYEQIAAMDWLRAQYPIIAEHTLHIGNERKSTPYAGYIMKRMGVLKGASDLFIAWPVEHYHGLFIELKSKIGKPTKSQLDFMQKMKRVGYRTAICYGAQEVIDTITEYLRY